ncbi:helix-turn-helix domain-containing protein [Peptoniphilaceae bacterium SGI.137]|nr:helix-turn-helix transcriptional regulator [Peptoniphilaceae bacterium]MDY6146472.1 helix-turn-helix transcriptional regulator [Peptoniphilaceae bacterium]
MKRKMSYKKLWKLLIDRDMKKTDLRTGAGISSSSLAKLSKDENVTTDVLLRICNSLDVDLNDIAETVPEGETVLEVKVEKRRRTATKQHRIERT